MSANLTRLLFIKICENGDTKKNKGLSTPDDIRRIDNILYGPDPKWNVMDIYYPKESEGILPVIVSVHGGGWVYGDKELYQYYCMSLAQHGFAVVNFSYPLAPEAIFPSVVENTNAVFKWIEKHASEYGFDVDNVFAVGDSAGAHTLVQYCSLHVDKTYVSNFSLSDDLGILPKAIALNCGIYDFNQGYKLKKLLKDLVDTYLVKDDYLRQKELMNLTSHIKEGYPHTFVMSCPGDVFYEQAPMIKTYLDAAGVENELHIYGDEKNRLGHVFHCDLRLSEAAVCNKMECDFFKKYM